MDIFERTMCAFGGHKLLPREWIFSPHTSYNWYRDLICKCGYRYDFENGYVNFLTHDRTLPPPSKLLSESIPLTDQIGNEK